MVRDNNELNMPSCGRAAALRLIDNLPRVQVPKPLRILRDRRARKASRSSEKVRVQKDAQVDE